MKTQRTLTEHVVNGLNEALKITVIDPPGSGGANHRYDITGVDSRTNPSATSPDGFMSSFSRTIILFQNGPIAEAGFNGLTNEALLAILIDRMRGFQYGRDTDGAFDVVTPGKYSSGDNAAALAHMQGALDALQAHTRARLARGVEGTHTV